MAVTCGVCGIQFTKDAMRYNGNKCPECGCYHSEGINHGALDPSTPIFENPVCKPMSPEQQKHEEIKRLACKFFQECIIEIECDNCSTVDALIRSWDYAELFYSFAKAKQEEVDGVLQRDGIQKSGERICKPTEEASDV